MCGPSNWASYSQDNSGLTEGLYESRWQKAEVFRCLDNILLWSLPQLPFSFLNQNLSYLISYLIELTHWTSEYLLMKSIFISSRCFLKAVTSALLTVQLCLGRCKCDSSLSTWLIQDSSCIQGRWGAGACPSCLGTKVSLQVSGSSQGYTETNKHLHSYSQLWPIKSS